MTQRPLRIVALLAAFAAGGCNAILGISDAPVVATLTACLHASDCAGKEVCLFRVCSAICKADKDCNQAAGERCLKTDDGTACVSDRRTSCTAEGPACPAGTNCVDGKCFSDCAVDASGCPGGQACASDQLCRATLQTVMDASVMDASAVDASVVDASVIDASVIDASAADDRAIGTTPRDCATDNQTRCEGNAQSARSICTDGKWAPTDPCADGTLCDTSSSPGGACATIEPDCFGHAPLDSFCDGATRIVCGPDLVSAQKTPCQSAQHCSAITTGCAQCLEHDFSCDANQLLKCKADRSGFELAKTCPSNVPCSAQAGDCTTDACTAQQKRCNGDQLEQCNADRSGFDALETCGAGLCDSQALECDKCVAKSKSCANGKVRTCSDDGQTQSDEACPLDTPICTGNGQCVACLDASSCMPPDSCHGNTCNGGACGFPQFGRGVGCNGGGVCNDNGQCVACIGPAQCTGMNDCYTPSCGTDGSCSYTQRGAGAGCAGGYCNASGACVECLNSSQCSGQKPICSAQGACVACGMDGQCAAKGVGLDHCRGNGACVVCVSSSQCTTATTPICDASSFSCRGCTQASPPTAGDSECSQRNGSSAPACKSDGGCATCTGTNTSACASGTPYCDGSNSCVQCLTSSSCTSPTAPICSSGSCAKCTKNSECAARAEGKNACDTGPGTCVQCVVNGDCGGTDVCKGDNTCCTPEGRAATCGANTCGTQYDNCGDGIDCGSCGSQNCCDQGPHGNPGVNQCQASLCE